MWEAVAVYTVTLVFVGYLIWINKHKNTAIKEVQILRDEMTQLAMAVGLRNRAHVNAGPRPIMPPGV